MNRSITSLFLYVFWVVVMRVEKWFENLVVKVDFVEGTEKFVALTLYDAPREGYSSEFTLIMKIDDLKNVLLKELIEFLGEAHG
jgi:phage anti-repressor protein